jgi:hypothetical protein
MLEARPYVSAMREAWNALNARARNGHVMFDRGFMEYHADRFNDASLAVFESDQMVALVPANRDGDLVCSHKGLTFGGLVTETLRTTDIMASLDACAAAWKAAGCGRLVYKPAPWIYHRRPAQEDLYWLFLRDARLVARQASAALLLDATGEPSQRRRRGAARAVAAGSRFGRSARINDFWTLLEGVLADRHDARPVHTAAEMQLLADRFPEAIQLHTAEVGGEVMAGALLFVTGPVVHVQYIASGAKGRQVGALDGLFMHLLSSPWPGARAFDFGTSNEDGGRVLNEGLIRQKEEFGAGVVTYDAYEIELR